MYAQKQASWWSRKREVRTPPAIIGFAWSADNYQLAALDASSTLRLWWMRPEPSECQPHKQVKHALCVVGHTLTFSLRTWHELPVSSICRCVPGKIISVVIMNIVGHTHVCQPNWKPCPHMLNEAFLRALPGRQVHFSRMSASSSGRLCCQSSQCPFLHS